MGLASAVGVLFIAAVAAGPAETEAGREQELHRHVQSLIARINDNAPPDSFSHNTPAVRELTRIGLPALRHGALELIISDDEETRWRGEYVLSGVVQTQFGFVGGQGWLDDRGAERCRQVWKEQGDYRHDMPSDERLASYRRWREWVEVASELTPVRNPNRLKPPRVDSPEAEGTPVSVRVGP